MTQTSDRYPIRTVLDHLSSVGVLDLKGNPALRKVVSLPFDRLIDLGVFIAQSGLQGKAPTKGDALFQCASVSLSGGDFPCYETECRLGRARELARYAIMLADRVYTYNPFSRFLPAPDGSVEIEDSDDLRTDFWTSLRVLREWALVIEEGLIYPFPHGDHSCHGCLAKSSFGPDASHRLDRAIAIYKRRFHRETTVALKQHEDGYSLNIRGPDDLITHGQILQTLEEVPRSLRTPHLLGLLASGRPVTVPPRVTRALQVASSYSAEILHTLRYGLVANQVLGAAYVTDGQAEVDLLSALSGSPEIANRNRIAAKHLSTMIPFLPAIPIRALLRLRNSEGDAFIRYRAALSTSLSALASANTDGLSEDDARSLFHDVIAPDLARITLLVREAKRRAISGASRSLLGWGAALTFGIYSGLVPTELLEAAKLLGVTGLASKMVSQVAAIQDAESDVRKESFYFLWRAKRLRGQT